MKIDLNYLSKISPYIRRAWDGNMAAGWELKERVIFDYEIIYIMKGKGLFKIDENIYKIQPGQIYFLRPGVRHWIKSFPEQKIRQPHIHFDLFYREDSEIVPVCYKPPEILNKKEKKYFREDINKTGKIKFPDLLNLNNVEFVEELIFKIITNYERDNNYDFLTNKALFIQLLINLLKQAYGEDKKNTKVSSRHYEILNSIKEYIRFNYTGPITLDDITELSNFSKNHLIRLFKEKFGRTPIQYKIYLRIERAKQLLAANYDTITEISQFLGFSDSQHFSKTFKKQTGLSPTEYISRFK